jgi:exosortase
MSVAATRSRVETVAEVKRARPIAWSRALFVGTVLLLGYGPLLWMFFSQQWDKPHYQYFPFVIAAVIWLLWERYKSGTARPVFAGRSNWFDAALPMGAAVLLAVAIVLHSPWCAMLSLIALVSALFRQISRTRIVANLWGIWVLLWLIVPLPFGLDQQLTKALQLGSSRLSSYVLDWFGVYHLMEGNTLWLHSKPLFVDEACSGIISMLSIVACAVVFAVFKNRTAIHTVLLAALGIAWAAIMNVVRISVIAVALEKWGIDWSAGTSHEILSLVLFLLTFLALLSMDQVLLVCLAPVVKGRSDQQPREMHMGKRIAQTWDAVVDFGNPLRGSNAGGSPSSVIAGPPADFTPHVPWYALLLFVPAALIQTVVLFYAWNVVGPFRAVEQRAEAVTVSEMPMALCGLNKVDFESVERNYGSPDGTHSRTYKYKSEDGTTYTISFDFPFVEYWHELTNCYRGSGWELIERRPRPYIDQQTAESWGYVEADFTKPDSDAGALWFAEFDQFGRPYDGDRDWNIGAISTWTTRQEYLQPHRIYQAQVWFTAPHDVTEAQRKKGLELLLAARSIFRSRIIGSTAHGASTSPAGDRSAETALPSANVESQQVSPGK